MIHQQQNLFILDLGKKADFLFKNKKIQRLKSFEKKVRRGYPEPRKRIIEGWNAEHEEKLKQT